MMRNLKLDTFITSSDIKILLVKLWQVHLKLYFDNNSNSMYYSTFSDPADKFKMVCTMFRFR